jgi:hypothetical protein
MPTEQTVTGYQWGDDLSYIGPYEFPIPPTGVPHVPPRTTLTPPPTPPEGYEAAMDVASGEWVIRPEDLSWMTGPENLAPGV